MTILTQAISTITKAVHGGRPGYASGSITGTLGSGTGIPATNKLQQMQAYGTVSWLFAVVSRISEAVASTEWKLYRTTPRGEKEELFDHPILDIWRQPNPFMNQEEFLESTETHMELTGEGWWLILRAEGSNEPVELWPLRPDTMEPIQSVEEFISGYRYRRGGQQHLLATEDVIFIKRPSPVDLYRGMGIIQALYPDLDSERLAAVYNRNFFHNSAEPGGIIEIDGTLSDAEFDRMKRRWGAEYRGVSNAHKVAILERGKWVERKITQREMQFTQSRALTRDVIIGAFGVPPSILGIIENVNRASAEAGEASFSKWVIRPRLRRLRSGANRKLCPLYGDNLYLDFVDPTPSDKEFNLNEAERGYNAGFLTLNEARERVGEDKADENGDEFKPSGGSSPFALGLKPPENGSDHVRGVWPVDFQTKALSPLGKQERQIRLAWATRLSDEATTLTEFIVDFFKGITKIEITDVEGYDWDWWTKYSDDVVDELTDLFELALLDASPDLAVGQARNLAVEYATERGSQLLRLDGEVNLVKMTRLRVNLMVGDAIGRGDSLQTLQKALREDVAFSPERARRVARTETATAHGQGSKQAAGLEGHNEKRWITQGDSLVSKEICAPNERMGWVPIGDKFSSGHDVIPGHVNCRCVNIYRTNEDKGVSSTEIRCPACNKLVAVDHLPGTKEYCPRCKDYFTAPYQSP